MNRGTSKTLRRGGAAKTYWRRGCAPTVLLAAVLAVGCSGPGVANAPADAFTEMAEGRDGPNVLSFAVDVFPLLERGGCAECHFKGNIPAHWPLTTPAETYRQWVNFPGFNHCDPTGQPISAPQPDQLRVIPGDPDHSLVIKKLTAPWDMCGFFWGHMPPAPRARLPTEQVELIRAWIAAGALP